MSSRDPPARARRFGENRAFRAEASAPPAESENEVFFSPPPTADYDGRAPWNDNPVRVREDDVEREERVPRRNTDNPFWFGAARDLPNRPNATESHRRSTVATSRAVQSQTSFLEEPNAGVPYTGAFGVNFGGRGNQFPLRSLPPEPVQPPAITPVELYTKRGAEFHKIGSFDLATVNRMRNNGLQRVSSITTIQHTTAVQDAEPYDAIAQGTPLRGAENSIQQLHDWPLSPVIETSPPHFGYPQSGYQTDRTVRSVRKQTMREKLLEKDESNVQASFHSARQSFSQAAAPSHEAPHPPAERYNYPRRFTITDAAAGRCKLPENIQLSMDMVYVFTPTLIVMRNPFILNEEEMDRLEQNMLKYWHAVQYDSFYDPMPQEMVCYWDVDNEICQRAVVVGRRHDLKTTEYNWRHILLLDGHRFGQTINAPLKDLRPMAEAYLEPSRIVSCKLKDFPLGTGVISPEQKKKILGYLQSQPKENLRVIAYGMEGSCNEVDIYVRKEGSWCSFMDLVANVQKSRAKS